MTSAPTSRRFGLRTEHKLGTAADFERARRGRERHGDECFHAQWIENGRDTARLGMAVSIRTAGTGVRRNRLRRLIRESFRMHRQALPAVDVFVTARAAARTAGNPEIHASLRHLWQRIAGAR